MLALVMDREEAQAYVGVPGTAREVTHLVSILNPGDPPLSFAREFNGEILQLRFDDIEVDPALASFAAGYRAVNRLQIESLIGFGHYAVTAAEVAGLVIFHCSAGIARSTAALLISFWAAWQCSPTVEEEIVAVMRDAAMRAPRPNRLMIRLADEQLAADGRLVALAERYHTSRYY